MNRNQRRQARHETEICFAALAALFESKDQEDYAARVRGLIEANPAWRSLPKYRQERVDAYVQGGLDVVAQYRGLTPSTSPESSANAPRVPSGVQALQAGAAFAQHQNGGGWVSDTAQVSPTAFVGPYAVVFDQAIVRGHARVYGEAKVYENAQVAESAHVHGQSRVHGHARVYGGAHVFGRADLEGFALVDAQASVKDSHVAGGVHLTGRAREHTGGEVLALPEPKPEPVAPKPSARAEVRPSLVISAFPPPMVSPFASAVRHSGRLHS